MIYLTVCIVLMHKFTLENANGTEGNYFQFSADSISDSLSYSGTKCVLLEKHNEHLTRKLKEGDEQVRYL